MERLDLNNRSALSRGPRKFAPDKTWICTDCGEEYNDFEEHAGDCPDRKAKEAMIEKLIRDGQ